MKIIDLLFPGQIKCIFCSRETREFGICEDCDKLLPYIKGQTCDICGGVLIGKGKTCIECKGREHNFKKCYCILEYKDEIQDKIISFKQNGYKHIGETFAYLIENKLEDIKEEYDLIIPVPISKDRLKEREFNQTEVLCNEIIKSGKVRNDILSRIKDTPHQTGLSRENRESNLKDSFVVNDKKQIKGKKILIIDDIYTTGSTINECANVLIKNGAKTVIALCLARTPIKPEKIVH